MSLQFELDWNSKVGPEAQAGRAQADENANGRWRHVFDACVLAAARKKPEIVSDDVLAELEALPNPPGTHNLAAIGGAMLRACKMGILCGTDRTKRSERPEKHSNRQNVYISKYYGAEEQKW